MIISAEEGTKLGSSFMSSWCASFQKNNHEELLHGFFADTVSWKMVRWGNKMPSDQNHLIS